MFVYFKFYLIPGCLLSLDLLLARRPEGLRRRRPLLQLLAGAQREAHLRRLRSQLPAHASALPDGREMIKTRETNRPNTLSAAAAFKFMKIGSIFVHEVL